MVRVGSRSRKRQHTRGGSRDRKTHKTRNRRDSRSRSHDSRRSSSDLEGRYSRSSSRVLDRSDSRDRDERRSHGRARRRSRNISRNRRNRSRSATRDRSQLHSRGISRSRGRPSRVDRERTPGTPSPIPTTRVQRSVESGTPLSEASTLAHALMEAIKIAQPIRSAHYFVSNFDPSINNIEAWCEEVDRARDANGWSDPECLSRVASCLKGDARIWLSEWVTNDRTWSNFKHEFKSLCPNKLDYANILFNAMTTTSDKYSTYAEYARRTLLR